MAGRAEWHTPLATMKNKEEVYQKLENTCWNPPKVDLEKEITYFNNDSKHQALQEYDLYFAYTKTFPLWDRRKNKENRLYLPDIRENIFQEEKYKPVPVLSSMVYGRPCRVPYDIVETSYRRIKATGEFYRRRGGVITPKEKKPV